MTGTILVGDYRDHLPSRDGTLVVTDPPYNIGAPYPDYDDKLPEDEYLALFEPLRGYRVVLIHYPEAMFRIANVLGSPTRCVAWVYNSNTPRQHRMIAWFNCEPNLTKFRQPYKNANDKRVKALIASRSEGAPLYDWWDIPLVKNLSRQKLPYVNQIPEEVIRRIILTTAQPEDLVFDPFAGSGTTPAVACWLGYNYLATDVSPTAVEIAQGRIPDFDSESAA